MRPLSHGLLTTLVALNVVAGGLARAGNLEVAAKPDGSYEVKQGGAVIWRVAATTPPLRRGNPRARAVESEGHHLVELRIPVRGRPSEEVFVGDMGARPPKVIWSGFTGPNDADEEVATAIDVGTEQIVLYQTAHQVTRCDGEEPRLFPRAYDFASGRWRSIVSGQPEPVAQKLTARRNDPAMPAGAPIGGFRFTAASTTRAAGANARQLGAPAELDDGNPKTVWAEGLGGDGRGEFLTARSTAGRYRVRGIRIVPGDGSSASAFRARNRIKSFTLALGPNAARKFEVEIAEDPAAAPVTAVATANKSAAAPAAPTYWVALPSPIESSCVTVVIRDVYRGTEAVRSGAGGGGSGGTTAISDLQVFTDLDTPGGPEKLVADTAAGTECGARVPLLVNLGEAIVLPAAQAILTTRGAGRECLVETLAQIDATAKSGVATDALAASLVGATAREERLIMATLRKSEKPPVHAVAVLLGDPKAAPEDRARAARALGGLDAADAATALLAAVGRGPAPVRLAVVQAIGRATQSSVATVARALGDARAARGVPKGAEREADLVRTLPLLVKRTPSEQSAAVAALRPSLAKDRPFEVRARAVAALGAIGGPAAVDELGTLRAAEQDSVIRYLATRELADVGGPVAVAALRTALGDADPRVRETAARGLGQHKDASSEPLLVRAAKEEPWPFVRRAEIEALSHLCGAVGRDLVMRAVERDVDEVRRAALVGLVRCRDGRARATLFSTVKSRRAAAPMRELAAALLGELGDRTTAADLSRVLADLVVEAEGDLAIEGVALAALRALGHLGGADAAGAAARLADDARHPYRHAAIEVLGQICDPGAGARTLASVKAGKDAELALAAQGAEQRCQSK